jgi:hypothetical protein
LFNCFLDFDQATKQAFSQPNILAHLPPEFRQELSVLQLEPYLR